ncbi:MAG: hypothetical protein LBQ54_05170 [Planctomycetaceae bacterium]|jgi:hypothetical protein|nr:hypothetical protein [Planctomycetaceae bacterium]
MSPFFGTKINSGMMFLLIALSLLLATGCASDGHDAGFPWFGKKSQALPPPTGSVGPQMLPPSVIPPNIQPGPGPGAVPATEVYLSPPSYIPPTSSSVPSPSNSSPLSTPSSSYPAISSPSSSPSYMTQPASTPSPYSNDAYPPATNGSDSGSTINHYNGYGPQTSITPQKGGRVYYSNDTDVAVSPSSIPGMGKSSSVDNPSSLSYSQQEIPVSSFTVVSAANMTEYLGGTLSQLAAVIPDNVSQEGWITSYTQNRTMVLPQTLENETKSDSFLPSVDTVAADSSQSQWDESEPYDETSIWAAMASQNPDRLFGKPNPSGFADNEIRTVSLTAQDYQNYQRMIVRGQNSATPPVSGPLPVLTTRAAALVTGFR